MNESAARAVLAGFILGYGAGIVFTGVAAVMLVRLRGRYVFLERAIAPNLTPWHVAVPLSLVTFLAWTMIGSLFGLLLDGLESSAPQGGLASPNVLYTSVILATGVMLGAPLIVLARPFRVHFIIATIAYVGVFGWGLPHLAI